MMIRHRALCALCLFLLAATASAQSRNIALNRPYTCSSPPNYGHSKDAGDNVQLTDGKITTAEGSGFWTSKSTVGWTRIGGAVSITIDLGRLASIGGLSFRTSGGSSNVAYPAFIYIWTSDDGRAYHFGGELVSASWRERPPFGDIRVLRGFARGPHRFRADGLALRGRYVKLSAWPGSGYLFCDEIEVFEGDFDVSKASAVGMRATDGFEQWAREHKHHGIAKVRMLYDLAELERHPRAAGFRQEIQKLRTAVLRMPLLKALDMSRGLPYTPLHARIWSLHGKMQRDAGHKALAVWPVEGYRPAHPFDSPPGAPKRADVHLIGNACRSLAVNVSNLTGSSEDADVVLQWKATPWPPEQTTLRVVRSTEAQERVIVGLALTEAKHSGPNQWRVRLQPGVATQLWLTVRSGGVRRGQYRAELSVRTGDGAHTARLPVNVHVHAGRAPDTPSLDSWMWDYLSVRPWESYLSVTKDNRGAAEALLREYKVGSRFLGPAGLPGKKPSGSDGSAYDRNIDGTLKRPLDFTGLDNWLAAVAPSLYPGGKASW